MAGLAQKEDQEIFESIVAVRRVAKVVKGGRRFRFAVLVVAGDKKGRIGIGKGTAREVSEARVKAAQEAKKRMVKIPLRQGRTLHHDTISKFGAGKVVLRSAPPGTGIIAGGAARPLLELLGIQDVVVKSIGSSNEYNLVKAVYQALLSIRSPKTIADQRGLKVSDIMSRSKKEMKFIDREKTA